MNRRAMLEIVRRAGRATPWLSLAASAAGLALSSGLVGSPSDYALAPGRLVDGELFRLWTGHFVHYGSAHLWGDLLAFAFWAAAVERSSRRLFAVTLFCATPLLSLGILLACPELREYRGLSGLDCALVVELILVRG
ncbi:MAG TPA: rhomboid family intramembrane serine protease, partial [Polyangiaceae bacterium]